MTTLAGNTGTVNLTDGSALTVNMVNSQNSLTATGAVTLIDDSITLTATTGLISASGQTVKLLPLTGGTAITLGGSAAGFDLTSAQLNYITASKLLIGSDSSDGNSASGAISLTAAIAPGSVGTLGLFSGSTVGQTTGNTITVGSLYVSGTSETLAANNAVSTVAMKASGAISFYSSSALTVGTVNSFYGVQSSGGTVLVNSGNNLTLASGSGAAVSGSASGSVVQLVDNGTFTNNEGSSAITATGGRWLVWSLNPANDNRGSLAYGFKQYNATYNTTTPADSTNNGFLYTLAPTVSLSLTGTVVKNYDGTNTATLAAGNYGATSGAVDGDTVTISNPTSGTYDTATAGSGKTVTTSALSITSAVNGSATVYGYQLTTPASGAIGTINPIALSITANNQTKAYGAAVPTLTVGYSGFITGESSANLTTLPTVSTTATAASSVAGGPYAITASGAVDPNYTISYTAGSLTVTPVALSITANNQTKVYGAALPTLTAGYSGFVNGDTSSSLTTQPTLSTTATSASSVSGSPYSITASGAADSNYTISYTAGSLTVTPASLTITANNQSKAYGAALPTLTAGYSGFVNGDTSSSLTTQPTLSTTATAASSVAGGPYSITASGAADSNYTISYTAGSLTVTPVALSITANNQTKAYGAALPTLTAGYSGFVNGDTSSSLTTLPTISTTATWPAAWRAARMRSRPLEPWIPITQ